MTAVAMQIEQITVCVRTGRGALGLLTALITAQQTPKIDAYIVIIITSQRSLNDL